MEELAAQHAVTYMAKYAAAVGALETLQRATPWELPGMMTARNPERVREHWRTAYRGIVNVIPTSDAVLREAALREANALPPASKADKAGGRGPKSGYRDVAVWLSAIEYAKAHPAETVYFVSANTKDFGDGSAYEYPASPWRRPGAPGKRASCSHRRTAPGWWFYAAAPRLK